MTPADELSDLKMSGWSRLRRERERRALRLRDVCEDLGIPSISMLAGWESGEHSPRWNYAVKLSEFYGVPVSRLFPDVAADVAFHKLRSYPQESAAD